jgi:hypothetical protein
MTSGIGAGSAGPPRVSGSPVLPDSSTVRPAVPDGKTAGRLSGARPHPDRGYPVAEAVA